jgi:hypothetical protein
VKVESKLILTSKNSVTGVNLYTFVLTYPRVILAEVNTHRMLSRNTASSRAIPSKKQRERVIDNPFVPISIGANQKGMQAGEELDGLETHRRYSDMEARPLPDGLAASWILDKVGAHKQVVNRIVEPWTWTQQIVTCTDLKNVFKLRNHKDAEPHFHELGSPDAVDKSRLVERSLQRLLRVRLMCTDASLRERTMWWLRKLASTVSGSFRYSSPAGTAQREMDWHLPFIDIKDTWAAQAVVDRRMEMTSDAETRPEYLRTATHGVGNPQDGLSTARCARVSYFLPENGDSGQTLSATWSFATACHRLDTGVRSST